MGSPSVILIANDVVPGMGLPVAAPGLRAHGLAEGLRCHGLEVTTLVDGKPLRSLTPEGKPPWLPPATVVLEGEAIGEFAAARAPAVVVITNSNQIDCLHPAPGLRLVFDFFAPKMLELACSREGARRERALGTLRERKLRAIAAADGFIVNGAKKVPYLLGWLLAAGRDPTSTPLEMVPMAVPGYEPPPRPEGAGVRFLVGGYLQGWSAPGEWLERLAARLDPPRVMLDLLLPAHWGRRRPPGEGEERREAVAGIPGVGRHEAMPYEDFLGLMGRATASVDLFARTLEREYAVVTRSVVALACGVPVVHPPFTEVSPLIGQYGAGWLVDPEDLRAVERAFDEIIDNPEAREAKARHARRLWQEVFAPEVAAAPLARLVRRLSGEGP